MRIRVVVREYRPKPTPHTLRRMDTTPCTPSPRPKDGELSVGHRIAIAVEVALAIPPGTPFLPRKCLGFSVGPPSVLVLMWSQNYLSFSVWSLLYWSECRGTRHGSLSRSEGGWFGPCCCFLPRKCLGFSVGPPSVLVLVWNPKSLDFGCGGHFILVLV